MSDAVKWFLYQGFLPLVGFAGIYALVVVVSGMSGKQKLGWEQARDSLAWIYGAAVIAVQLISKAQTHPLAFWTLLACLLVFAIMLNNGMTERAKDPFWKPTGMWYFISIILVTAVLVAGFIVHGGSFPWMVP